MHKKRFVLKQIGSRKIFIIFQRFILWRSRGRFLTQKLCCAELQLYDLNSTIIKVYRNSYCRLTGSLSVSWIIVMIDFKPQVNAITKGLTNEDLVSKQRNMKICHQTVAIPLGTIYPLSRILRTK